LLDEGAFAAEAIAAPSAEVEGAAGGGEGSGMALERTSRPSIWREKETK